MGLKKDTKGFTCCCPTLAGQTLQNRTHQHQALGWLELQMPLLKQHAHPMLPMPPLPQATVVAVAAAVAAAFADAPLPLVVAVAAQVAGLCSAAPECRTG